MDLTAIFQLISNSVLCCWNGIDSVILVLVHLSAAYFLIDQAQLLSRYKKYSVPIPDWQKHGRHLNFSIKMVILSLLFLLMVLDTLLSCLEIWDSPLPGLDIWIRMLIVIPMMRVMIYYEMNYKLSLETEPIGGIKSGTIHLGVILTREALLIISGMTRIVFDTSESSASLWTAALLFPFLRGLAVAAILNFTLTPIEVDANQKIPDSNAEKDESSGDKDEAADDKDKKGDEEKKKHFSPTEIWAQFYAFRKYVIPTEFLARISFIIFLCLIFVDSGVDLYSNITYRRILDSLHISDAGTPTPHPETAANASNESELSSDASISGSATIKLEFRWDYLLIYSVLKFSQWNVIGNLKYYLKRKVEKSCCSTLQMELFTKLHKLSLRWHLENKSLEVFSLMSSAPSILMNVLSSMCWLTPECLNMVFALVYLVSAYSFKLSGIVIFTAIISVTLDVLVVKWRDKALQEMQDLEKETREARAHSFENYETVKYFTNEDYERDMYEKQYEEEQKQDSHLMSYYNLASIVREFCQGVAELGVILIVVKGIVNEEGLTTGDYIYFSGIFSKVMSPVESVMRFYQELQEHAIELEKVMNVLVLEPEITDEPGALPLELEKGTGGSIEFRNVNFSYTPDRQILSNLSFFIEAGKTVAFVGHSGCGKSTVARLLFRFYDPISGEILIDGQNIRKAQCHSLRKQIGVVPQDIVLFDDTIKENIRYGNIQSATDEDVIEASKMASLHDRIETFPDKYETEVGSRGLKLSGGEKQRVAIARTIVKNPPIVILDEATSALDTETERQIQSSLRTLCENRTSLIIAHRLSTIVHADKIIVLKDGAVAESGTHEELLLLNGLYAHMWNQQFNEGDTVKVKEKPDATIPLNSFRVKRRRQLFSSRLQQTVWTLLDRRALTMETL